MKLLDLEKSMRDCMGEMAKRVSFKYLDSDEPELNVSLRGYPGSDEDEILIVEIYEPSKHASFSPRVLKSNLLHVPEVQIAVDCLKKAKYTTNLDVYLKNPPFNKPL